MTETNWNELAGELKTRLNLTSPPLAITFSNDPPAGAKLYEADIARAHRGRPNRQSRRWVRVLDEGE